MKQGWHMQAHLRRLTIVTCLLVSVPADAQTWPSKLIKATIPFGAGSATDVVPRMFFDRLSHELGQPIVVENRAGAGGTVGTASQRWHAAAAGARGASPITAHEI
jgi:tripartite-type tricarboxylate transporter receptor subunit TctC